MVAERPRHDAERLVERGKEEGRVEEREEGVVPDQKGRAVRVYVLEPRDPRRGHPPPRREGEAHELHLARRGTVPHRGDRTRIERTNRHRHASRG